MRTHWEGMGGPKCLGLGGRGEELSASAMGCDESPWEGVGTPKSLGLGERCGWGILQVWKVPNSNVNPKNHGFFDFLIVSRSVM